MCSLFYPEMKDDFILNDSINPPSILQPGMQMDHVSTLAEWELSMGNNFDFNEKSSVTVPVTGPEHDHTYKRN